MRRRGRRGHYQRGQNEKDGGSDPAHRSGHRRRDGASHVRDLREVSATTSATTATSNAATASSKGRVDPESVLVVVGAGLGVRVAVTAGLGEPDRLAVGVGDAVFAVR